MDELGFLDQPAGIVAPRLLGCHLIREIDGNLFIGKIVETEAYDQSDAASHSYKGKTPRTGVMFGPSGHLYVYFTYGMHYCCNVVTGGVGHGSAVLIRALEPVGGFADTHATNGPAKLCKAMQIDKAMNGHDLHKLPLRLKVRPALGQAEIVQTTRVGISKAQDVPWRFYIRGNRFVSRA
jgi:DNA-3-methyladenine glycosylase